MKVREALLRLFASATDGGRSASKTPNSISVERSVSRSCRRCANALTASTSDACPASVMLEFSVKGDKKKKREGERAGEGRKREGQG